MRKVIVILALLLVSPSSFSQNNNSGVAGGKTSDSQIITPARKKPISKPAPRQDKAVVSPCGVSYRTSADMSAESNSSDKWFSLGESANKHFWYNPHKTTCDAKTGVLKSWMKEEHKNTDGDYAMVLYEFKCKTTQMRQRTVIEYDRTGSVLETTNHDDEAWQDVAPGTAGEVMLRTVCRRQ